MKTFQEFTASDVHEHPNFDNLYSCFVVYIGREWGRGDEAAVEYKINITSLRKEYDVYHGARNLRAIKRVGNLNHKDVYVTLGDSPKRLGEQCHNPETSLARFKTLNQDIIWVYEGMYIAKNFSEFRSENCQSFTFARDGIADLTPRSQFEQALPSHIKLILNLAELAAINVNEMWPTLTAVFGRVFASNSFDSVALAIEKKDLTDPIAFYSIFIVVS
ncbi:hypothetical protein BGZ98_001285 [Dissophora globulifera]|nr:hypothetical protein BGZ98_001285 [Dissophora globulifera]